MFHSDCLRLRQLMRSHIGIAEDLARDGAQLHWGLHRKSLHPLTFLTELERKR